MEQYLLKYLQDRTNNWLVKKYIDYFKVNLDGRLYAYGDNMNPNYPEPQKWTLRNYLKDIKKLTLSSGASSFIGRNSNVLSLLSMPQSVSSDYGLNIIGSIFNPILKNNVKNYQLIKDYRFLSEVSRSYDFNMFLDQTLLDTIEEIKDHVKIEYVKYNFRGLFVGNGEPFVNKLHIEIFKELGIPSFIFLHGIPGIYNLETEKKADYLLVWGDKIKENYISAGFDKDRIFVIGSPKVEYKNNKTLRHSLDNVLVTTSSSVEWSPFGWDYSRFPLNDRSLIILYCYVIQDVLKSVGVKKARLRLHPSVGKNWINHYIDESFYSIDMKPLQESLSEASLVIGPTSTVWLESLLEGVNYLVFEPGEGEFNFRHIAMVPPFDNSESDLRVAKTEDDLKHMILSKYMPNLSIIDKYIQPFNFNEVNKLLK